MAQEDKKTAEFLDNLENPEAIQEQIDKTSEFAQSNKETITGVIVAILVIVGGAFWYQSYQADQEKKAQEELFPAVFYLQKDSVEKALQGDGNMTIGMEAITDEHGGSKAANLSSVYIGVSKMKEGKFDEAIESFKDFSADDYLLQSRVYSLIGDAYMEKAEYGDAISYYGKAVGRHENSQFTPVYLRKLGLAKELSGDNDGAIESYQKIVDDFEESREKSYAEKMLTKLGAK